MEQLRDERDRERGIRTAVEDGGAGKVHVAVGKSVGKAVELLTWALRAFPASEICIVHLHHPSPRIPTPLGYLPASQADEEVLSAYRMVERQQMRKLLFYYLTICSHSKVKASVIAAEAAQVQRGIVDLVSKYGIRRLVMGVEPERSMAAAAKQVMLQNMRINFVRFGLWTEEIMLAREMLYFEARVF